MDTTFSKSLPITLGADHAGYEYKDAIKEMLQADGWQVIDKGTNSADSVDYPDFAHPVASMVEEGTAAAGILVCGSGIGVSISANRHKGVRAGLCWNKEVAALCRQHNGANVICLPARFVSIDEAKEMVQTFLATAFEGGRHERRVEKIEC